MLQEVSLASVNTSQSKGTEAVEVPFAVGGSEDAVAFAAAIMNHMCRNMGFREAVSLAEKELMDFSIFPEVGTISPETLTDGHTGVKMVHRPAPSSEDDGAAATSTAEASITGHPRIKSRQSKSWQANESGPVDGDAPHDRGRGGSLFAPPRSQSRGGRVAQPHSRGRGAGDRE
jgi:hypothetical protein